jgi:ubiquinone/menaquinone biosynthesis C-methylase UbiE
MPDKTEYTRSNDGRIMNRYDQMANSYDRDRYVSEASRFMNRIEIRVITDWVHGDRGRSLLDVPCGTGRLTIAVAHLFERVIAGDISNGMIAVLNNKIRSKSINNIALLRINSRRLPFPENTFDIVLCVNFFHLIHNNEKHVFMAEFSRVLKPRGKLILENVSPIYGQLHRLVRRRVSLSEIPGKLVLPRQGHRIFRGFRKRRELGIGFPLFAGLAGVFGESTIIKITLALGRVPFLKLLGYTTITELEKESPTA